MSITLIEKIEDVTVEKSGNSLFLTGPFIVMDKRNRNSRIYLSKNTIPVVEQHIVEYVNMNKSVGELDHPTDPKEIPIIHLDNVTHIITELTRDGDIYYGRAKIIDTPKGNIVKGLIDAGVRLGASTRAVGSLSANGHVNPGMTLITPADIVYNPSAVEAVMDGIYESANFVEGFGEQQLHEMRTLMKSRGNWLAVKNNIKNHL